MLSIIPERKNIVLLHFDILKFSIQGISYIANIYNKKTKGTSLMELFTATGKLKKYFLTTRDV
jgi:hypothetical protein